MEEEEEEEAEEEFITSGEWWGLREERGGRKVVVVVDEEVFWNPQTPHSELCLPLQLPLVIISSSSSLNTPRALTRGDS